MVRGGVLGFKEDPAPIFCIGGWSGKQGRNQCCSARGGIKSPFQPSEAGCVLGWGWRFTRCRDVC